MRVTAPIVATLLWAGCVGHADRQPGGAEAPAFLRARPAPPLATGSIVNADSGLCLGVGGSGAKDGDPLIQVACPTIGHANPSAQWQVTRYLLDCATNPLTHEVSCDDEFSTLRNLGSGKCLDRPNDLASSGTVLQQLRCDDNLSEIAAHRAQQWIVGGNEANEPIFAYHAREAEQVLDVPGHSQAIGQRVQLARSRYDFSNLSAYSNQAFTYNGTVQLVQTYVTPRLADRR